ncbi:MAG TPA: addiction module protein [Lacipirellulaceae bacterium]|jgi:putative addiction module component (TIGR02574 family)
MSTALSFDVLTSQVLALPPEQRAELAQRLWASVEGQLEEDEELFAEIDRRCADIDSGKAELIPFDQAMREIRARLNES